MAQPTPTSTLDSPSHSMLHNAYANVRSFGATGDGATDDTAAIQAAIEAAGEYASTGDDAGMGQVFFPAGQYKVTSSLDINLDTESNRGIRITGPHKQEPHVPGFNGAEIFGAVSGAILSRTTTSLGCVVIDDIDIVNTHATGTGIALDGVGYGAGIYRCDVMGHKGLSFGVNTFTFTVADSIFRRQGSMTGSYGIETTEDHKTIIGCDFSSFEYAIYDNGVGVDIIGCRTEECIWGVTVTGVASGQVTGCTFEANDTAIRVGGAYGVLVAGNRAIGTASTGTAVGHSVDAFSVGSSTGITFVSNTASGVYSHSPFTVTDASCDGVTFIGCDSTASSTPAWVMASKVGVTIINCSPETDIVRAPVIATASLPTAATQENGRVVIEDAGTGNRNLILYAGGERFRIDGGANV